MANRVVQGLAALVAVLGLVGGAQAGDEGCEPGWASELFCHADLFGDADAAVVWDDGSGPALYVGGTFTGAGCAAALGVARWDGTSWSALGSGLGGGGVKAMAVFDDGTGPALYVGGTFTEAGGSPANRIAKWDGSEWSALGSGITSIFATKEVAALTVFDDGTGPALYAAGTFNDAGGEPANHIAKWDGSSWSTLGDGTNSSVFAMTAFDDGSGPALYAGGSFLEAGGIPARRIARWDGLSWSALGSGIDGGGGPVSALVTFDDGTGESLFAGGQFTEAGDESASRIAKWDGSSWTPVGSGVDGLSLLSLSVFDDGSGLALFAGGRFSEAGGSPATNIAKWDGTTWSPLGTGVDDGVFAMTAYDDGSGEKLYSVGEFTVAGGRNVLKVAKWDGSTWSPLQTQNLGVTGSVRALVEHDDGSGRALYAAGEFIRAGGETANRIARWDGSDWYPLESGLSSGARALATFDDGSGESLIVGGRFTEASGVPASRIASWDGSTWSPLGSGLNSTVTSLAVFNDGSGPALFAGGGFTEAGGVPADYIAKWDGLSWTGLESGMNATVWALTVFDDGTGPALYAGGNFTEAGGSATGVARWDGSSWSPLGTGMNGTVHALTGFDDGTGRALYAAGRFTVADGAVVNRIAKWDGASWQPLESGTSAPIFAMANFDDGTGTALYVAGEFRNASGTPARHIARWDGSSWSRLDQGTNVPPIEALYVFDDPTGSALFACGSFWEAGGAPSVGVARWGSQCVAVPCPADVTGDNAIDLADLNLVLANFGQATTDGDATGDGNVDLADLNAVLGAFGTVCP